MDYTEGMTTAQKAELYSSCNWGVHGRMALDPRTQALFCTRCKQIYA